MTSKKRYSKMSRVCTNKSCSKAGEEQHENKFYGKCSKCITCINTERKAHYRKRKLERDSGVYRPPLPLPLPQTRELAIEAAKGDSRVSLALRTFYRAADVNKTVKVDMGKWPGDL